MHLKGMYKEMVILLDTCEALSMFDQITAPNIQMIASSKHEESAVAQDRDGELSQFLSDNFSRDFFEFLYSPVGYTAKRDIKISDFPR